MTLPLPFVIEDDAVRANFDALAMASPGTITYGVSPAFTWSGGITTVITVPHGLGRVPKIVVVSGGGDPSGGDTRFPLAVTAQAFTSTTFDLAYRTHDNTAIGVFGLGSGVSSWIAIA